jgi:GNAT superfamily N-acetyltransferase
MISELLPPKTGLAFRALSALRPAWTDEDALVREVDEVLRPGGYRIVGAFDDDDDRHPLAVAGFRVGHSLAWGRYIHVSDLSTLPAGRGRGFAPQLLDWVKAEAKRLGCDGLHVDSGVSATRRTAHRVYFNAGYEISAHHFMQSTS